MKNFKNLINITALAVISIFIISCSTTTTDEYYNLIPSNSIYVVSIDGGKLDKAADLNEEQKAIVNKNIDKMDLPLDEIDLKVPIYFFLTSDFEFGVVAKIKNVEEFASTFDSLKTELKLETDAKTGVYSLVHNDEIAMAYKGSSFILIGKNDEITAMMNGGQKSNENIKIGEIAKIIMNGESEPFASTDSFKTLKDKKSDIGYVFIADTSATSPLFKIYPDNFVVASYNNFEAGRIVCKTEFLVEPTSMLKVIKKYVVKPEGKFDKYIPSDYIMYANGATSADEDPRELLEMSEKFLDMYFESMNATMAMANNRAMQSQMEMVKNVVSEALKIAVSSFNGESVFTVNSLPMMPEVVFMADVRDNAILERLISEIPANMVTKKADTENQYVVNATFVNIEVGIKDNVFYITNSPTTFNAFNEGEALEENFSSTPFAKKIKGTYGGLDLRIDKLLSSPLANMGLAQMGMQQVPVASKIENIELILEDVISPEFYVNMKDKDNNALNTIMVDMLDLLPKNN